MSGILLSILALESSSDGNGKLRSSSAPPRMSIVSSHSHSKSSQEETEGVNQALIKAQAFEIHKKQFLKGEFTNIRMQDSYREFYEHKNKEAQAFISETKSQVRTCTTDK